VTANELDHDEGRVLLRLAHASVGESVRGVEVVDPLVRQLTLTPRLREARGVFVTLRLPPKQEGGASSLRGCIGTVVSSRPLYRNVVEMAANSARADPRFPPVTVEELPWLRVEVSALTPLVSVPGPEAVRPGVHGVQLTSGNAGALFLPQVAREQGWGTEQLLTHLALKAGLPKDGWIDARLSVFEAQVFCDP
jgi:AmmeMemoRadiSam system protein A